MKKGGVGLFYYAGHGIQSQGRNSLRRPTGGPSIESEAEWRMSPWTPTWCAYMEDAQNRVNIVVLDACRNNPFARGPLDRARPRADGSGPGRTIAYATAPGSVAADGAGRNGAVHQHLLASLRQPESDIEKVFKRVRAGVRQ